MPNSIHTVFQMREMTNQLKDRLKKDIFLT